MVFAFSVLPSPSDLEIREVPPMPKSMPIAINKRNAGYHVGVFGLSYKERVSQIIDQYHDHADDGWHHIADDCFRYRGIPEYFCCFVLHNIFFLSLFSVGFQTRPVWELLSSASLKRVGFRYF